MTLTQQEYQEIIRRSEELVSKSKKNINQMEVQRQEFFRQHEARIDALLCPFITNIGDSIESKNSRFFKNGDLSLSDNELVKLMEDPKQSNELYREIEKIVVRQRASEKTQNRLDSKKWFGGDRVPDIDDMLDPKKLKEMLVELDQM